MFEEGSFQNFGESNALNGISIWMQFIIQQGFIIQIRIEYAKSIPKVNILCCLPAVPILEHPVLDGEI